eukprot:TRINITY_DN115029_c0_g1_i1.p1 TRINITY_DN115029_c0_g1~~TRINITY_DN115029_c0_g1_i1.p1  ORF type:complete len:368 (-),score=98.12 TRINITY_DN115029_c0_g1_i1:67-1113(-)
MDVLTRGPRRTARCSVQRKAAATAAVLGVVLSARSLQDGTDALLGRSFVFLPSPATEANEALNRQPMQAAAVGTHLSAEEAMLQDCRQQRSMFGAAALAGGFLVAASARAWKRRGGGRGGAAGGGRTRCRERIGSPADAMLDVLSVEQGAAEPSGGRKICIDVRSQVEKTIAGASAAALDGFMERHCTECCLEHMHRSEPLPEEPGKMHCYLLPLDIGMYQVQVRLTIEVATDSQAAEVKILNMEAAEVNKTTGEADFSAALRPPFTTANYMTWQEDVAGGVTFVNSSTICTRLTMPWWFPLPDSMVQRIISFFMSKTISSAQKKTNNVIEARFATWFAQKAVNEAAA